MEDNIESKLDLEKKKLELEIRKLSKPWWRKLSYSVIITGLAVIGTLSWTFGSGIINVQRERLEKEKAVLAFDIREFQDTRDSLEGVVNNLYDSIQQIGETLDRTATQLLRSKDENKRLRLEKSAGEQDQQKLIDNYETYVDSLETIIGQYNAIQKVLTADNTKTTVDAGVLITEDGMILTTEDGRPLYYEVVGRRTHPDSSNILRNMDGTPILDHNGNPIRTR